VALFTPEERQARSERLNQSMGQLGKVMAAARRADWSMVSRDEMIRRIGEPTSRLQGGLQSRDETLVYRIDQEADVRLEFHVTFNSSGEWKSMGPKGIFEFGECLVPWAEGR
jgi:hypothetical protein